MSERALNPAAVALREIASYHAHVYYAPETTKAAAEIVRQRIGERFLVRIGSWHDGPVGPHPKPMFQVAFATNEFARLVPWLMLNRMGLSVLVHPNTDRPRDDHLVHALWLGEALPLDASNLPFSASAAGEIEPPVVPNTQPHLQP
jgi:aromatic ring-cleaving dioxygenase